MFWTLLVLKDEISKNVNFSQLLNIYCISFTFSVLNPDKSKEVSDLHIKNISFISLTFFDSNLFGNFKLAKLSQLLNIAFIFSTSVTTNLDKSKLFKLPQ